ncbi:hypothetical protein E2C01_089810 [Portunus trituberculatus]|uniref:Uncharacterized protein n=1 Tax=Portunus trituberculatus TaxID=210409 RepID=A0A5B7J9U3_PORTR|nr:hypothetical protein [Portunus trituberculatus]
MQITHENIQSIRKHQAIDNTACMASVSIILAPDAILQTRRPAVGGETAPFCTLKIDQSRCHAGKWCSRPAQQTTARPAI